MRNIAEAFRIFAIVTIAAASIAHAGAAPADDRGSDNHGSVAIVFADGHRQTIEMADILRIDFKTPVVIVFKDGHQQNTPAGEIARIEFEGAASASAPSRNHFVGKWEVGQGNGSNFYITLEANGDARKTLGSSHGTWSLVDGEARISWDDGWHDAIRKVGTKHEKFAYEPGKSFSDTPTNVTDARNTEPKPI
jgi:hypothetical protein